MPSHSIAKSAVKPIFSPLPHPTFFAPKSPFFPLFPVSNPIPGDFSRNRARFLPCEAHFFLVLPRFGAYFRRFFDGTSLFSAPNFNFPRFRALLQENSPFIIATLLFSHSVNAFPIRFFPFFILYPTFLFPLISFPPFIPPPSSLLPPLSFSFLPTFPSSSPITHERAHPRALRAYAYTRTYSHVRRFLFIAFTASPTLRNPLCTNALGVKENEKRPSPNTQSSHNQYIRTKHPISSTVNFISSPR